MKLAITVCATKNYCYAMKTLARRVHACVIAASTYSFEEITVIISGDNSKECKDSVKYWETLFPKTTHFNVLTEDESAKNYKEKAQLTIAKLREAAFTEARRLNVDFCWSLDSDTLPPPNSLRCMLNTLEFDNGYYQVSSCPYPNTEFLGGFGTYQNQIAEDFLPNERKLPDELKKEMEANDSELAQLIKDKKEPTEEQRTKWAETNKKIKECPPDGNIWEVIAKHGWRKRGWLSNYAPAIGVGAFIPVSWVGFGCTLLNKEALYLSNFDGYEGRGTEDLWVIWNCWAPNGLKINTITHCAADHVIATRKKGAEKNEYQHYISYHEREGEYQGHLRTRVVPWIGD
jgi:hypothetical protein